MELSSRIKFIGECSLVLYNTIRIFQNSLELSNEIKSFDEFIDVITLTDISTDTHTHTHTHTHKCSLVLYNTIIIFQNSLELSNESKSFNKFIDVITLTDIITDTHTHTHTPTHIYIYIINYNLLFPLVISSKKVKKSFNLFLIQPNYIAEPTLIT